ncbi:MAG: endonuclease/exonuclease/phosphatase family protein [Candidatus Lokiarchaeota archaeon]|nr:endonuclease/exonuclease/phosphatase family protein [Candidatus Lokiarchaeota archaeon]
MIIRLLQWNIWYKEKIENIIKTLKFLNPDIICLQELSIISESDYYIDKGKAIKDELSMHYHFEIAQTKGESLKRSQGNAIFSKYDIKKKYHSFIQKQAQEKPDASSEGRVYVEVDLDLDINGYPLKVGTTHMSYTKYFINKEQKKKEAKKLVDIISARQNNYIFTGDLNSRPYSFTIKQISKYLKNCGPDFKEKTWTTKPFEYYGFKETKLNWRLDYVFSTKDMVVCSSKIVDTPFSDHLPILVEFEIS